MIFWRICDNVLSRPAGSHNCYHHNNLPLVGPVNVSSSGAGSKKKRNMRATDCENTLSPQQNRSVYQSRRRSLFPSVYTNPSRTCLTPAGASSNQIASQSMLVKNREQNPQGSESPRCVVKFAASSSPKILPLPIEPLSQKDHNAATVSTKSPSAPRARRSILGFDFSNKNTAGVPIPGLDALPPASSSLSSKVSFNDRVVVREFVRHRAEFKTTWYSKAEMDSYKHTAMERIHQYSIHNSAATRQWVLTGIPRMLTTTTTTTTTTQQPTKPRRVLFSHPALGVDADDEIVAIEMAKQQIKRILVVDPYYVCINLFRKSLQKVLPYSTIVTCQKFEDATKILNNRQCSRFDLVVAEQHLLDELKDLLLRDKDQHSLVISVSPNADSESLNSDWADLCWSKPPPSFNSQLRKLLLTRLLQKRGKEKLVQLHL